MNNDMNNIYLLILIYCTYFENDKKIMKKLQIILNRIKVIQQICLMTMYYLDCKLF